MFWLRILLRVFAASNVPRLEVLWEGMNKLLFVFKTCELSGGKATRVFVKPLQIKHQELYFLLNEEGSVSALIVVFVNGHKAPGSIEAIKL